MPSTTVQVSLFYLRTLSSELIPTGQALLSPCPGPRLLTLSPPILRATVCFKSLRLFACLLTLKVGLSVALLGHGFSQGLPIVSSLSSKHLISLHLS